MAVQTKPDAKPEEVKAQPESTKMVQKDESAGRSEKRKRDREDEVEVKRSKADESRYWGRGEPRQKWGGEKWQDNRGPHQLTLKKKYIHQIKHKTRDGLQKTVEGRINSGIVLRYRKGDRIRFFYQANQSDDVTCLITDIKKYASFKEMLEAEGVQKCLTDVRSLAEGVRIYDSIPSYPQRAAQHGVVAIHLSVV
eukprot:TRINITY_DN304_c4_g1_i1.p2 TRINITY_DN304_c4_g1~~TRINITY_DN304_c4_g1_i1.p2  ORF type:complete len:195 (+),score=69.66 TRINITY_DN304_c4_g1_i1:50-634(+)